MIVTVTTVVVLVIGLLSLALTLYGGYVSTDVVEGLKGDQEAHHRSEQRYYLLGMIGIIVLTARLLNVPLFLWMLQSLVPYCPNAMCAYGVVNAGFPYSTISLILKLLLPFAYGAWIVLELANRRHPRLPLTNLLARSFLVLLLPLVLLDSASDILLVSAIKPIDVPCCSSAYDVNPPFSPSTIFGPQVGTAILILTITLSLLLIVVQWVEKYRSRVRLVIPLLCIIVSILYVTAIHDVFAPLVLGLATHHCPYCLFQEFPDTAFFAGLFWVGIASAGWRFTLESVWTKGDHPKKSIESLGRMLIKISSVAILFSMVSMVSHLLLVM